MKVRVVLFDSSSLYVHHWRRLVPPAFALALIPAAPLILVPGQLGPALAALLGLPVLFVLQALHVVEAAEVREGRPAPLRESFRAVRPRLRPLLGAILLGMLKLIGVYVLFVAALVAAVLEHSVTGVVGGLVAFYALLLYLVSRWSMVVPVILLEGIGARKAFRRSRRLVHGHGFRVLGVILLASLAYALVDLTVERIVGVAVDGETMRAFLKKVVAEPLAGPFLVLMWTNAYFALGGRPEPVAAPRAVPVPA
jgi:hypothetical protein